ncbi:hypothetical protein AB0H76_36025 [Nocardia sp. NPDC050712]|uniref:hypothetical protein n=1 Tax=Nocardia sp. NPDC050712 TaxID=3155518 RepID=UPI003400FA5B
MTEQNRGLDPALYDGLERDVAEVLAAWAELHRRYYKLDRWLVNGRSRQPVAVVCEIDSHTSKATMLVLKVLSAPKDSLVSMEFARHRQAELDHSAFAADHLSTFFHDAIPVPSGHRWITFQRIAAHSLESTEVLTVLLRRMLGVAGENDPQEYDEITCTPGTFTDTCRAIVAGVLGEWAGPPFVPPHQEWDPATFLGRHIFDQLDPGGRLESWARDHQTDMIRVEGESVLLPNPFAVAQGRLLTDVSIAPLVGRCHGDLHTDNALVQVRPRVDVTTYFLIDTALYESVGPLTRDPVHLVLYVIARTMETIAPAQHSALIELLLDPINGPGHLLPGWLSALVQGVDAETRAWIRESGLEQRWREQTFLSLAGCALLFLGRTSTREQDKSWFLRLAARAVAKFAAERRIAFDGSGIAAAIAAPLAAQHDPQTRTPAPAESVPAPPDGAEPTETKRRKKGATYNVKLTDARGVQIGENGRQFNIG